MHCYCANYYGAVNCKNKVSQFGQRCKLCTVLNEGTSAKGDIFKINSNDYAYDSEGMEDDDDSSREGENSHGRTRDRSKSSSK